MTSSRAAFLTLLLLLLLIAWLYAPALEFGLIWDDPLWFGRVLGEPLADLLKPTPDYHFYRPGLLLYIRLFLKSNGTFNTVALHAAQIAWHLLNVILLFVLGRRLRLPSGAALAAAMLTALSPFSYQAVAWAAPAQPLSTVFQSGAWLTFVLARQGRKRRRLLAACSLALFTVALFVQEITAALALVPLLLEWVLRRDEGRLLFRPPLLTWLYPLIALAFGLLWLMTPRQAGYTTLRFESEVIAYLLQGFVFPLLGNPWGYAPNLDLDPKGLLLVIVLVLALLLWAAWRAGRARYAVLGLTWAFMGIAPSLTGLRYEYASLASRLLYGSSAGAALLWACALTPPSGGARARQLWRGGGAVLLLLIALQSVLLLADFGEMYAVGAAHLDEFASAAQVGPDRMLFVNFPDRYAPKRMPYPLGYWGLTLAPVSVDLSDFAAIVAGVQPKTSSHSMPWIDQAARESGPYNVDLRGVIVQPQPFYELARQAAGGGRAAVYLSRYMADGAYSLLHAGDVVSDDAPPDCRLATFGDVLCLQDVRLLRAPGQLCLWLTWQSMSAAQPHDTIFAHLGAVGQPPVAQADGDLWLGMLPLTALQPGDLLREQRIISLPAGRQRIQLGVYNRLTGQRLPAKTPQGEPLPEDALVFRLFFGLLLVPDRRF